MQLSDTFQTFPGSTRPKIITECFSSFNQAIFNCYKLKVTRKQSESVHPLALLYPRGGLKVDNYIDIIILIDRFSNAL